ncbi:MAG: YfhO family protein [Candidatus Woesearchaeota archaeon]|jgi:hypothetical protein
MNKKYIYGILAIIVVFTFYFTSSMLKEGYPNGGDSVGHYDLLLNTIDALKLFMQTGELRFWNPDYYLGFPMFFFYSPLPYITLAVITLLTGIEPLTMFNWSIVILFSILPVIFYICSRLMNFDEEFALGIALFSTTVSSVTVFGLEYYSFFATGLYSQLWGIVFLPFAFAYSYRYFALGKGKAFLPVLFLYLTFISHLFAGIIAVTLICILIFSSLLQGDKKNILKKTATVFVFFAISTAFFTIPYLLNTKYFGNIPFDSSFKEEGYGIKQTITYLFDGQMLDYSFSFSRLPILTGLCGIGILLSIFWQQFREKYPQLPLCLALSFIISLFLIAGEKSFGFLAYIPIISTLQTFRFITLFHFTALIYIGIAVFWLITQVQQWNEKRKVFAVLFILLIISAPILYERMQSFKEYAYTYDFQEDATYWNIVSALQSSGRTYITSTSGLFERPQHLTAIPILTHSGIFASTGIGGHDSLNAYYSSFFLPLDLIELFNIHNIIDSKNNELTAYISQKPSGYFGLYTAPFSLDTSPIEARESVLTWLFSNASKEGYMMTIEGHEGIIFKNIHNNNILSITEQNEAFDHRVYATLDIQTRSPTVTIVTENTAVESSLYSYLEEYSANHDPQNCGTILEESNSRGTYKTTVSVEQEECYTVFKMTYHPEWRVFVDDIEQEKVMISPAFMGVAVSPGTHEILFTYAVAKYRIWLFIIGIISLIVLLFWKK